MHGQFAIGRSCSGPQGAMDRITARLHTLTAQAAIHARVTPASGVAAEAGPRLPYRLTGRALDQTGLVHQVANLLRSHDVNIESMETTLEAAPVTGAPVFEMDLVIAVPRDTSMPKLPDELGRVCDSLNIDWHLAPL